MDEFGEKLICPKCENDTFKLFEKRGSSRMLASMERRLVCTECGYYESIYKIGAGGE